MNVLCQFIIYILSAFYPMNKILISSFLCFFFSVCEPSIILCINCNKIGVVMTFWNRECIFHYIHAVNICMDSLLSISTTLLFNPPLKTSCFSFLFVCGKAFVFNASSAHFSVCFFQFCLYITLLLRS